MNDTEDILAYQEALEKAQGRIGRLRNGLIVAIVVGAIVSVPLGAALAFVVSEDQRKRDGTLRDDVNLLADVMNKLAGVSDDKGLGLLAILFSELAQMASIEPVSVIDRQWDLLCRNPGSQSLFEAVAFGIQSSYDTVCERYLDLFDVSRDFSAGIIGADDFQSGFNLLIMALIQLDNAIASDP